MAFVHSVSKRLLVSVKWLGVLVESVLLDGAIRCIVYVRVKCEGAILCVSPSQFCSAC